MASKESIQSLVSSGSMSGSWVGRPSWITVAIGPLGFSSVPDVGVESSVTRSSSHAGRAEEIYPSVVPPRGPLARCQERLTGGHGLRPWGNSGGLPPPSRPRDRVADRCDWRRQLSSTAGGGSPQTDGTASNPADR